MKERKEEETERGWLLLDPGRPILTVLDGLFRYGDPAEDRDDDIRR